MFPSPQSHLNVRLSVASGSDDVAVNCWVMFVNVLRYVVPEITGFAGGWFGVIVPVYCRSKKADSLPRTHPSVDTDEHSSRPNSSTSRCGTPTPHRGRCR